MTTDATAKAEGVEVTDEEHGMNPPLNNSKPRTVTFQTPSNTNTSTEPTNKSLENQQSSSSSLNPIISRNAPRPGLLTSLTQCELAMSRRFKKKPGLHMDLATGAVSTRCQSIQLVSADQQLPSKKGAIQQLLKSVRMSPAMAAATAAALEDEKGVDGQAALPSSTEGGGTNNNSKRNLFSGSGRNWTNNNNSNNNADSASTYRQYRITSKLFDESADESLMQKSDHWWKKFQLKEEQFITALSTCLHWAFRAGFLDVVLVSFVFFMILITFFSILIYIVDLVHPECIVGINREGSKHIPFGDAYHLSWTTLSTVGYGVTAPGLPSTTDDKSHCTGVNFLMAFESFVGVLFSGLTGAIIFAKIARIQSVAPVTFSDPIVVRYGTGCIQHSQDPDSSSTTSNVTTSTKQHPSYHNHNSSNTDHSEEQEDLELPCPILEFRLVNNMWNNPGGEIMDASVMLVASRLETVHDHDKHVVKRKAKRKGKPRKPPKKGTTATRDESGKPSLAAVSRTVMQQGSIIQKFNQSAIQSATEAANNAFPKAQKHVQVVHTSRSEEPADEPQPYNRSAAAQQNEAEAERQLEEAVQKELENRMNLMATAVGVPTAKPEVAVDEGNGEDERLAPRRIFHSLEVQTDSHPFFRRTWNIRHVCDENSPLLPPWVRARISENNGFWPPELNSCQAVRKVVNFHEIIVSFSGTANVSGSSVYTQKIYNYVDMTVGYTFVNVLAKNKEGKLYVDTALLNDVKEQWGGGAEPIQRKDLPTFTEYTMTNGEDDAADGPLVPSSVVTEEKKESDVNV